MEKRMTKLNWPTAFVSTVLILAACFAYYIHHNCDHLIWVYQYFRCMSAKRSQPGQQGGTTQFHPWRHVFHTGAIPQLDGAAN